MYVCILPVINLVIVGIILKVREKTYGFDEKWSIDYWIFILNIIRTIH